jgi:hypothetical protein
MFSNTQELATDNKAVSATIQGLRKLHVMHGLHANGFFLLQNDSLEKNI